MGEGESVDFIFNLNRRFQKEWVFSKIIEINLSSYWLGIIKYPHFEN